MAAATDEHLTDSSDELFDELPGREEATELVDRQDTELPVFEPAVPTLPRLCHFGQSPISWGKNLLLFFGPAQMVAFGYIDPGNWALDISSGAAFGYKHLVVIVVATFLATLVQMLSLKLGIVANMDLARACREHLPSWINIPLWLSAEIAIMATDLAEVIGSALALNMIFGMPLWAGVLLTIFDVLAIVIGLQKHLSLLEAVLSVMLLLVFGCLVTILGRSHPVLLDLLMGMLPADPDLVINANGLYLTIGLVGATVMPHSLYLGSHLSQHHFEETVVHNYNIDDMLDNKNDNTDDALDNIDNALDNINNAHDNIDSKNDTNDVDDTVSNEAVETSSKCCGLLSSQPAQAVRSLPLSVINPGGALHEVTATFLRHSTLALAVSLGVACLVNCLILAVAAANFFGSDEPVEGITDAFDMLTERLDSGWAVLFAVSLLISGQAATITSTIAGAVVMDGFLNLTMAPWLRRLVTRALVIAPSLAVAFYNGKEGLDQLLVFSQVVLSIQLPFSILPLVRFTSDERIMGAYANSPAVTWITYAVASLLCFLNVLVLFL